MLWHTICCGINLYDMWHRNFYAMVASLLDMHYYKAWAVITMLLVGNHTFLYNYGILVLVTAKIVFGKTFTNFMYALVLFDSHVCMLKIIKHKSKIFNLILHKYSDLQYRVVRRIFGSFEYRGYLNPENYICLSPTNSWVI